MAGVYRDLLLSSGPVALYRLDDVILTSPTTSFVDLVGAYMMTNSVIQVCQAYRNLNLLSYAMYASAGTGGLYRGETARFNWQYNTPFSFHFWFVGRGSTPAGTVGFFGKCSSLATALGYALYATSTTLSWRMANSVSGGTYFRRDYALPSTVWDAGRWTHFAVTYDGSGNRSGAKVYLDGDLLTPTLDAGAASISTNIQASEYFTIQYLAHNSTPHSFMGTNGAFSDFAIYSKELTAVEVASFADFLWDPSCRNSNADIGWVRSASRPAKNVRNITTGTSTRKKKRRKVNPGVN